MQGQPFAYFWLETGSDRTADRLHALTSEYHFWREVSSPPRAGELLFNLIDSHLRDALLQMGRERPQWRLMLDRSMPVSWQFAPWESLVLDGAPLSSHALVCRMVRPTFGLASADGEPRADRSGWLDLFPKDEFDFARTVQGGKRFPNKISRRWAAREVESCDELFVMAHGGPEGLINPEGLPESLEGLPVPKRIWLLACNENGALFDTARTLLARGARTVVTSTGKLDAPQIAQFVASWMNREDRDSLEHWLARMRCMPATDGGARTITLFGDVACDVSESARWNERTLRSVIGEETHLKVIADRLDDFSEAIAAWESPGIWPMTAEWMLPELLRLAENHDHSWMLRLERLATGSRRSAALLLAMAISAYRSGYYPTAMRFSLDALEEEQPTPLEAARLHGMIVNIGLDLNLLDLAERAVGAHRAIHLEDIALLREQEHRRLDWEARIALRRKKFSTALRLMRTKRRTNLDPTDTRELAWLIYINAWACKHGEPPAVETQEWLDQALDALNHQSGAHTSKGNDPKAYLLRALACHAWACADDNIRQAVVASHDLIHAGLDQIDPGPWAFALCYVGLMTQDGDAIETAIDTLSTKRYFLEAATLSALGGLQQDAKANVEALSAQQRQLTHLFARSSSYRDVSVESFGSSDIARCIPC